MHALRNRCVMAAAIVASAGLAVTPALAQPAWQEKSGFDLANLAFGVTGNGILVGQIELGTARTTHNSLDGAVPGSKIQFQLNSDPHMPQQTLNSSHATRVASIIAGNDAGNMYFGSAPNATLAITDWVDPDDTRVFNAGGMVIGGADGPLTLSNDFLAKMNWFIMAPRARIVNMSAGLTPAGAATLGAEHIRLADWAATQGQLMIFAAGNSGAGGSNTISSPNAAYNALTVGSTGRNDAMLNYVPGSYDQVRQTSSLGRVNQPWTAGGVGSEYNKPDLVAPGAFINSAIATGNNAYDATIAGGASGTSFAAPQVAGAAALLHEWGNFNGLSTDQRVMRSVLMNSTVKTVKDNAGVRWDEAVPKFGQGVVNMSPDTGTGRLDALQALFQYDAGKHAPTFGVAATGNEVPVEGWDLGSVNPGGVPVDNAYRLNKNLRKGSYLTSTVSWNRSVGVGGGGDPTDPADYLYNNFNDLDLGVAKLGAINTILQKSNSAHTANEHMVYKVPDRDKYYVHAYQFSNTTGGAETYGLAWWAFAAPTATASFNGGFSPNMGAPVDNGWYLTGGAARVGEAPWVNIESDAKYAMELLPGHSMAQELVTPVSFFDIYFDFGFASGAGADSFKVFLGAVNILEYDSFPGDTIDWSASSFNQYDFYLESFDLTMDPIWATLTPGFTELRFESMSGNLSYIDNVYYVPPAPSFALALGSGLLAVRRRRAALASA